MGIQGLTGLLRRHAPKSLSRVVAQQYQQKTLAIDASCPLNRFIYGDEPHPFRHIYGFYMLAKFCERYEIKPIFVFDGANRLLAKETWEHRRRQRGRDKIKHSLVFEQSRSTRLASWLATTESQCTSMLTAEAMQRVLHQLAYGGTDSEGESEATGIPTQQDTVYPFDKSETLEEFDPLVTTAGTQATAKMPDRQGSEEIQTSILELDEISPEVKKEQELLEWKLTSLAKELHLTQEWVQDREKYTKTVRDLSQKEYDLMTTMIHMSLDAAHRDIQDLIQQNDRLLASYTKRALSVTAKIKDECQHFLTVLGYTCITCDYHEAEAMCANLVQSGKADAIVSEDMDSIVFGDSILLRYFFAKNRPILCVDPVVARQQLDLSKDEFLDLCILCGTDFGSKIVGVGPVRALEMIKQHRSIEEVLIHLDPRKYIPEEGFDYRSIREVFRELPPIPNDELMNNSTNTSKFVDRDKVESLLRQYEIDPEAAERQLDVIIQQHHHQQPSHTISVNAPAGDIGFGSNPFQQPYSTAL